MLSVRRLTLFAAGRGIYPLWEVDLEVGEGERVAVVGESGGGKTSLAWAALGRPLPGQRIEGGSVRFEQWDLTSLSPEARARLYYRRLALVPQNVQDAFHPTRRLWQSAQEVLERETPVRRRRQEVLAAVAPLGERLDLSPSLWDAWPHQLSGGQKQRMGIILALLNGPRLLVLDEPTHALDELTRSALIAFLEQWRNANGAAVLLFTHDIGLARSWGGRMVVLYRGEIVEELPGGEDVEPLHPYTRGLMGSALRLGDPPRSRHAIQGHATPLQGPPAGCGFANRCPLAARDCAHERPVLAAMGRHRVRCSRV